MAESISASGSSLKGSVRSTTAKAIVFHDPVSLEDIIDLNTGKIIKTGHDHFGKSIKNKIVVAPNLAYNPDLEFLVYVLAMNKCEPKGIAVTRASSNLILGAVLADIPLVYGFTDDLSEIVKTGDKITLDLEKPSVQIK